MSRCLGPVRLPVVRIRGVMRPGKIYHFTDFLKMTDQLKSGYHGAAEKDPFNVNTARICSEHFENEQFVRDLRSELLGDAVKARHILRDDAIPIRKLPYKTSPVKSPGRSGRAQWWTGPPGHREKSRWAGPPGR